MIHSHLLDIIFRFSLNFSLPHQTPLILGWSATPFPAKSQQLYSGWRSGGTGSYFKRRGEIETRNALWQPLRISFFLSSSGVPRQVSPSLGFVSCLLVWLVPSGLVRVNLSKWKPFYNSIQLCDHSTLMLTNRDQMQITQWRNITWNNQQELKQTLSLPTTLLPHKNSFHLEMSMRRIKKKKQDS